MSRLSDFLRRRRIDPSHQTRRALIRFIEKRGFEVGDHTYGEPRVMPWGDAKLKIGSYCSIGPEVAIFLGGGHHTEWVSTFPFKRRPGYPEAHGLAADPEVTRGDVVIGHDVWIGAGATILSGVTIGHGAVIGARAVVSRDVAPYAIAVGNPARVVRRRFPDADIADLLETAWWELDRAQIVALLPLLNGPDIAAFIAACRAARGQGRIDFAQASGD